jgi:hypothetical protein
MGERRPGAAFNAEARVCGQAAHNVFRISYNRQIRLKYGTGNKMQASIIAVA